MSDKIEKFILENADKLDGKNPSPDLWGKIESGLNSPGGGSGGEAQAGGKAAGKTGTILKWGAGLLATAAIATGIWFATNSGKETTVSDPDAPIANNETENGSESTDPTPSTLAAQYELLYHKPDVQGDQKPITFQVDAETGGDWKSPHGSKLIFPAHAFVDANGNPVSGEVDLHFREFQDAADVFFSGIPMKCKDEKGEVQDFQTAGMMELFGYQNGEPVFIADGKEIEVSLSSLTGESGHKTWFLDPETGDWLDKGKHQLIESGAKDLAVSAVIQSMDEPVKPMKPSEAKNAFEIAVDYSQFPELKPYQEVTWQFTDEEFIEENEWIYTVAWENAVLEEKPGSENEYYINLKRGGKKFKTVVTPLLKGADYELALTDFEAKKSEYDALLAQRKNEEARLQAQSDFARSFGITRFGVWNCDRFIRRNTPSIGNYNADFKFPDGVFMDPEKTVVYLFTGDNRTVIPYPHSLWQLFWYPKNYECNAIAVLPDGKYAMFSNEDFKKLEQTAKPGKEKVTIEMQQIEQEIKSPLELRVLLGG